MEIHMTTSESTKAAKALPGDFAYTIRGCLGNRRLLLAAGIVALVAGTAFNWGWLVTLGIAPVLLSLLPCLVMCGLGVCCMKMMGGSGEKQSGPSGNAAETAEPRAALGIAHLNKPSLDGPSCCHGDVNKTEAPQVNPTQPRNEGEASMRSTAGTR
jgi:hypothetical protein